MKVKRLIIKNIGMIGDMNIPIDKSLIIFYGDLMQGKTTILNAVKFAFGGSFPTDIIKHGQEEASVTLEFDGGSISREWYRAKDKTVKVREMSFIRDGKAVKKPVDEIKKFLNPFLLDQDYLRKMTETERKVYFTQLFSVDTSDLDKDLFKTENDGRELRAKIKGYGEIDLTEVKSVDATLLKAKLERIRKDYRTAGSDREVINREISRFNSDVNFQKKGLERLIVEIQDLEDKLIDAKERMTNGESWLKNNPIKEEIPLIPTPDTSALESQISEAAANEVRYEQYQKNIQRTRDKLSDENKLSELEAKYKGLRKDKTAKLSKISETCGIKELSFDELGNFIYQGTTAGMLSTSQIMKLSSDLSALYPEGIGLDLIDRGESLGKSIFLFVDRAEREKKSILATIVGEKPAKVPENVGVWVVENGEVKP